jgi:hypothetical protein
VFSFGDEDNVEDKSDNEKFMDELWRDYDDALDSNIGTHGCEEVLFLLREYHSAFLFKFFSALRI